MNSRPKKTNSDQPIIVAHQPHSEITDWLTSAKLMLMITVFSFVLAFVLGVYGYTHYHFEEKPVYFTNALYHTAQLFLLHAPHFDEKVPLSLEIARWLAALFTILVFMKTITYILHQEWIEYKLGRIKNHTIVCGLGRKGMVVIEKLHRDGIRVAVIEKNPQADYLERLHQLKIPLILGDATNPGSLNKARIHRAKKLIALCPQDTTNCEIALIAGQIKRDYVGKLSCLIHINDNELRNALQFNLNVRNNNPDIEYHFMDAFASEAIALISHILPLDHNGIKPEDTKKVHLVLFGFGNMGKTIAVKAAQLGQFANAGKMKISVIDRKAEINKAKLFFHHPYIEEVADFKFYQQECLSRETYEMAEKWTRQKNTLLNVVFCFDDLSTIYEAVLNLLPLLKKDHIRVAIRINKAENLDFLLQDISTSNIRGFGIDLNFENLISPELDEMEKFAQEIHKTYIELTKKQLAHKPEILADRIKKGDLKGWNELMEDLKESSRQQAIHIFTKVRAAGYEIVDQTDPGPAIDRFDGQDDRTGIFESLSIMEHNRWMAERKVNNWSYAHASDKSKRKNKNLIPWVELTEEIREYDYEAVALIPDLLSGIGKKMVEQKNKSNPI